MLHSNSGSDENIDDLLYEYNHYLNKAHNQRKKYLEKYKLKNKMPLLRQDLYKKQKKYNNFYSPTDNLFNTKQFQHGYSMPNNIMDIFIPIKSISRNYNSKIETSTTDPDGIFKAKSTEKIHKYGKEYCTCQNNLSPCDCNNNPIRNYYDTYNYKKADGLDKGFKGYSKLLPALTDNMFGETLNGVKCGRNMNDDLLNNIMNIKLKIDIQVPKYQESFPELCTNCAMQKYAEELDLSPTIVNMPFPYFPALPTGNYGPTNIFKIKSDGYNPMHKLMTHKKKKSRNNGNKKHRKKSAVSFQSFNINDDKDNVEFVKKIDDVKDVGPSNITENPTSVIDEITNLNSTDTQELSVTVNVTFNAENQTDNMSLNNVVETTEPENSKTTVDDVTTKPREKRDTVLLKNSTADNITKDHKSDIEYITTKLKKSIDKDKNIISDDEMLYWPELAIDTTLTDINNLNITKEVESRVPSSNIMTKITHNNETSLINVVSEKFDWSDMEKVVPVFISFFGKYFNGIMTFCTDTVCHSVKCNDKTCIHRYCSHENRLNYKGHCHKSNTAGKS